MDTWAVGAAYEPYVGRWSRLVAAEFVAWLEVPPGRRWADIGCGTGALTTAILAAALPSAVVGVDQSEAFLGYARGSVCDRRASFVAGTAVDLPWDAAAVDVTVSGLMLNFVPDASSAAAEFARVTAPGGVVAAYVWDYAEGMQLMRHFWDAAIALDPAARDLEEGLRFPLCRPAPLESLFAGVGLADVEVRAIDVPTRFQDFDDYWTPFLGGQGPAPGYAMALSESGRDGLREALRARLPVAADGSIPLTARAWAVRGRR